MSSTVDVRFDCGCLTKLNSQAFAFTVGGKCAGAEGESIQHHWDKIQSTITGVAKAMLGISKRSRTIRGPHAEVENALVLPQTA